MQLSAGLFVLCTSLELLSVNVALMLARERLKFNLFSLLYQLNSHYCAFSWYSKLNTLI